MACDYCDLLPRALYEDAIAAVIIPKKPATPGHLIVVPKGHHTILEEAPDNVIEHCMLVANKTSIVLFEAFGGGGTNIIVQNGIASGQSVPHFSINVLPRKDGDGLSFKWQPGKLEEQKMNEVHVTLKEECDYIGQPGEEKKPEMKKEEKKIDYSEENYLIRQLRRLP